MLRNEFFHRHVGKPSGASFGDEAEFGKLALSCEGEEQLTAMGRQGPRPTLVGHRTLFRSEHLPVMGFEYPGGRPRVVGRG